MKERALQGMRDKVAMVTYQWLRALCFSDESSAEIAIKAADAYLAALTEATR